MPAELVCIAISSAVVKALFTVTAAALHLLTKACNSKPDSSPNVNATEWVCQ